MRYIEIKLDGTPIQMEPVTIRQYNNLVDTVMVKLKSDMDGLVVEDYNVFVQTDLVRRDKIPLTPCRSSVDIVVEEGYLGYTWPIDSAVTRYTGVLQFEVQLEHKTDAAIPIWQSEVCKLITVAPNICDNTALGDDGPAILQEVYQQLQTLDDQADQAAASATNAAESERLAGISATDAAASNQNAATHEQAAKDYTDAAEQSATAAGQSATLAGQQADNAATHEQAAKDYADTAAQSNTAAEQSATLAGQQADAALESKQAAAASANTTTSDRAAAAASAAAALASAQAASAAVDLQIIDDTTGTHYQFGADNGLIYLEEVTS